MARGRAPHGHVEDCTANVLPQTWELGQQEVCYAYRFVTRMPVHAGSSSDQGDAALLVNAVNHSSQGYAELAVHCCTTSNAYPIPFLSTVSYEICVLLYQMLYFFDAAK